MAIGWQAVVVGVVLLATATCSSAKIVTGNELKPKLSLTISGGPSDYTSEILDILDHYSIKAAFFLVGEHVLEHPEVVERIVNDGHEVGVNGWKHIKWTNLTLPALDEEVLKTQSLVHNLTSFTPRLCRPPGGLTNRTLDEYLTSKGLTEVLWSIDTTDAVHAVDQDVDPDKLTSDILDGILAKMPPCGGIMLMHETRLYAQLLSVLLSSLKLRGYEWVPVQTFVDASVGAPPRFIPEGDFDLHAVAALPIRGKTDLLKANKLPKE